MVVIGEEMLAEEIVTNRYVRTQGTRRSVLPVSCLLWQADATCEVLEARVGVQRIEYWLYFEVDE